MTCGLSMVYYGVLDYHLPQRIAAGVRPGLAGSGPLSIILCWLAVVTVTLAAFLLDVTIAYYYLLEYPQLVWETDSWCGI